MYFLSVLSMYLFVLCDACLTVAVNCFKQFAICLGAVVILLLNVMVADDNCY